LRLHGKRGLSKSRLQRKSLEKKMATPLLLAPLQRDLAAAGIAFVEHTPNHIEISFRGVGKRPLDDVFIHCRTDNLSNLSAVAVSSSFRVPASCMRKVAELISLLNMNSLLTGAFECDARDGEVRCRVSLGLWPAPGDEATTARALTDSAWGRAMMMAHSQFYVFLGLMEELLTKKGEDSFNKLDEAQLKVVCSVFESGLQKVLGDEMLMAQEEGEGESESEAAGQSEAESGAPTSAARDSKIASVAEKLL
jgi:hypothetical protein